MDIFCEGSRTYSRRDEVCIISLHIQCNTQITISRMIQDPQTDSYDFSLNYNATQEEVKWSEEELYDFARKMLAAMVQYKTRKYGSKPSLAFFVRLDIGLIQNNAGELSYFVNEMERTGTCSLWSGALDTKG
jgi:hypothetical protein